jgi:threonine dehydrogenase-like Zn-dependent dehydrogenase
MTIRIIFLKIILNLKREVCKILKALNVKIKKIIELSQKKTLDPKFKSKIYDLIDLEEVSEVQLINDNWVKVKVKLGGICGSDLHFLSLNTSSAMSFFTSFPLIPGHELVGTIVEIGDNVKDFFIGDRVLIEPPLPCEVRGIEPCNSCKEGDYSLCSNLDKGDIKPGMYTGLCADTGGGWGEYIVAHKSQLFKIPETVSFEEALIAEPLAVAIHGIFKKLPEEYENCVILGCGTIGLTTIMALKSFSKCNIIALAKYPFQSELAKNLGADDTFLVKKNLHIKRIGRKLGCRILTSVMGEPFPLGGGADIVIDSVGNASSLSNCIRLAKPGGNLILLGVPAQLKIDWSPMLSKEIKIIPSFGYSHEIINNKKQRTFQIALDLIASGSVNVKDILTHQFPIEDYKSALEVASNKSANNSIKTAFAFE